MAVGTGVNYEKFNVSFFQGVRGSKKIKWFHRTGLLELVENRIAEITLVTNGTVDTYRGYSVKIVNKVTGQITSQTFYFDDYMKERKDGRRDFKGGFSIVHHCCERDGVADWYIAEPTYDEINKMGTAILKFIEIYK